ncbi:MAG: sigma 54-interacting transcriptional regulator [Candidatus Solibacter sp.]
MQLVEAVFDQLPFPTLIYATDRTIQAVNRAARHLLATSSEDVAGRTCAEVLRCQGCDRNCVVLEGARKPGFGGERTVRIMVGEGRKQLVTVSAAPLVDSDGQVLGTLAVFTRVLEQLEPRCGTVIAESAAMRAVVHLARRVAISAAMTVLLEGETGTGKEVIARLLHEGSWRRTEPFVAINCAAMPETLLESELFGYEKGAFTDARTQKKGLFELANQGTLFLDEIGELPLKLQAKLLRVLDERSFRRVGGLRDIPFDVRIVAATNRNLRQAVAQGEFRLDLFYRLNVIQLTLPPLRGRRADILPLARFFIAQFSRKFERAAPALSAASAGLLEAFDWPGNVRELRNAIERSVLLDDSGEITPGNLPIDVRPACNSIHAIVAAPHPMDVFSLRENEEFLIARAMAQTGGNQSRAAKVLGVSRDVLRSRMKRSRKPAIVVARGAGAGSNEEWP